MLAFVIVLQVIVALFLIGVVLLQPGNRGGASAALGGAGSDTVFGARGANTFLSKITFGAATCFMVTNLLLSYMSSSDRQTGVMKELEKTATTKPAAEAPSEPKENEAPAETAPDGEAPKEGNDGVLEKAPSEPQKATEGEKAPADAAQ